jgi:molybdopterin converting factor small subunit
MSATIEISSIFGRYTNNQLSIKVEGSTVGECIEDFLKQYPDMRQIILNKDGKLRHNYDIYINGKSAYPLEMSKPVNDGDKLNLIMLIQGG